MKKKLLFYSLFLISSGCFAQINKYFEKNEKSTLQFDPQFNFHQNSLNSFTLNQTSISFNETGNTWDIQRPFVSTNQVWMGTIQQSRFDWNNIPVNINYQFDIYGRFRESSMSFRIK